jgi:hypothetical protein
MPAFGSLVLLLAAVELLIERPPVDVAYGNCILRSFPYFSKSFHLGRHYHLWLTRLVEEDADIIVAYAVRLGNPFPPKLRK